MRSSTQSLQLATRLIMLTVLSSLVSQRAAATEPVTIGPDHFIRPGYEVHVYEGPWKEGMDLDAQTPIHSQTVFEFSVNQPHFTIDLPKDAFIVLEGYLEVPSAQHVWFAPGWDKSKVNVMTVGGREVYRLLPGQSEPINGRDGGIELAAGLHHFRIIHFTPTDRLICFSSLGQRLDANYLRTMLPLTNEIESELVGTLNALAAHAANQQTLSPEQIDQHIALIDRYQYVFGKRESIIRAALNLVATHDQHHDYLFETKRQEWGRNEKRTGLRWAVFLTMQYLLDQTYTIDNLTKYPELLGSVKFATADYFPGPVKKPADPEAAHTATVWATFPHTPPQKFWMTFGTTARKATGAYLAPGTIATVTVPEALVGKGFAIRVGAHSNDLAHKPMVNRLYRATVLYPINQTRVQVANPLGGGIYLEVPIGADEEPAELVIQNVVRAPLYANTRARQTTLEQWQTAERHHPAPWADFQSDAFMMQLPRTWVYNLEDPVAIMAQWDKAVTSVVNVLGYEVGDVGREAFYIQPDTQLRNSVFSPGHPQVNVGGVEPSQDKFNGHHAQTFHLRGPRYAPDWVFHEWGHAVALAGPAGESETSNNFLHTTALNWGLGIDMDTAFGTSRGSANPFRTIDNTAVLWMTGLNFTGGVMHQLQRQYQLKGHAKYVDVARLFGWQTIGDFYRTVNEDRIAYAESGGERGEDWPKHIDNGRYIRRLSEVAGVDMRPLFHFWGVPPTHARLLLLDRAELEREVAEAQAALDALSPDPLAATEDDAAPKVTLDDEAAKPAPEPGPAHAEQVKEARKRLEHAEAALLEHREGLAEAQRKAAEFEALIASGKVQRSAAIYDQLVRYKSLTPEDNQAFRAFALRWYDNWQDGPHDRRMYWTENDHRKQWERYDAASAQAIRDAIDGLLGYYFPQGRPPQ